jgi:hypothetical protein
MYPACAGLPCDVAAEMLQGAQREAAALDILGPHTLPGVAVAASEPGAASLQGHHACGGTGNGDAAAGQHVNAPAHVGADSSGYSGNSGSSSSGNGDGTAHGLMSAAGTNSGDSGDSRLLAWDSLQ